MAGNLKLQRDISREDFLSSRLFSPIISQLYPIFRKPNYIDATNKFPGCFYNAINLE